MLDRNDIEILQQLIHNEVTTAVNESEARMNRTIKTAVHESETRMLARIQESETSMKALMESMDKKIDTLVDGIATTNERIDRLSDRMDEMNETVLANTLYIVKDARDKKAQ